MEKPSINFTEEDRIIEILKDHILKHDKLQPNKTPTKTKRSPSPDKKRSKMFRAISKLRQASREQADDFLHINGQVHP